MNPTEDYTYIVAGGGLAGLSFLARLADTPLKAERILLIDPEKKVKNDRTWCFWEAEEGPFETVVFRNWSQFLFRAEGFAEVMPIQPYRYKMIRGLDFYGHCYQKIKSLKHLDTCQDKVAGFSSSADKATVTLENGSSFRADWVFNSALRPVAEQPGYNFLWQHFMGWVIKTQEATFNENTPTFMDFDIEQEKDVRFCYVLPHDAHTALVEYTLFSANFLTEAEYRQQLEEYITETLGIKQYEILEVETGAIPMTDFPFKAYEGRIIHLGTAGGDTKASTGYTFQFLQRRIGKILQALAEKKNPARATSKFQQRFRLYDSMLLNLLIFHRYRGSDIFRLLFQKNKASQILKFLDEKTSFAEELKIFTTTPYTPFLTAMMHELVRKKMN